jgi:hypothetical protein
MSPARRHQNGLKGGAIAVRDGLSAVIQIAPI